MHRFLDLQGFQQNLQPQPLTGVLQVHAKLPFDAGNALQQSAAVNIQAGGRFGNAHIFVQISAQGLDIADAGRGVVFYQAAEAV